MFHFHKWSDWAKIEQGKIIDNFENRIVGSYITQERYCSKCGEAQLKTNKTTLKSDTHLKIDSDKISPKPDLVNPK